MRRLSVAFTCRLPERARDSYSSELALLLPGMRSLSPALLSPAPRPAPTPKSLQAQSPSRWDAGNEC